VIYGAAYDDALGDELRVTVVATGLSRHGAAGASRSPWCRAACAPAPTTCPSPWLAWPPRRPARMAGGQAGYDPAIVPRVWTSPRTMDRSHAAARVDALSSGGMDDVEIPAFLRKQAD
jgi:cell division protein FtsZ